jgi:hypothetical protein
MGQRHQLARRRPLLIGALAASGLLCAAMASSTHPFTVGADAATAFPAIVALTVLAVRIRTAGEPTSATVPPHRSEADPKPLGRWSLVWLGVTAAVGSWELFCYLGAPRSEHPTLSTLIDLLDSSRAGKMTAFALWLLLGWYLVLQ